MSEEVIVPEAEETDAARHARWVNEIIMYERTAQKFTKSGHKIAKRYKDERSDVDGGKHRFNILWSNVQTLMPALYGSNPKPDIERRFMDEDNLGKSASQCLERCTSYFVNDNFGSCIRQAVLDRLLSGRGTTWVRYVPHFRDIAITGNEEVQGEGIEVTNDAEADETGQAPQEVYYEEVIVDYVNWEDFGHTFARTWEEMNAGWRRVYLDRKECIERFGEELGSALTLDYTQKDLNDAKVAASMPKATIYEIWDKVSRKAIWIHREYPKILDEVDDPYELEGFFPFPRPLFATLANDSLIPVADYIEYQDQARELDEITARIAALTKVVKIAGVYDASAEALANLLTQGIENKLVPVSQWATLAAGGGVKGIMDFLPLQDVVKALMALYECRDKVKSDLYEITGIADIIRGASEAQETMGAQKIKSQFATLRLSATQDDIQRFCRDLVSIMAQIIAKHFSIDTMKEISGLKLLTAQEKQQYQMMIQQQQQMAQQPPQPGAPPAPPPPPIPDKIMELMDEPTWEDVDNLFKNISLRCFKLDIETDSTIKSDQEAEQMSRVNFLKAAGGFMQQAAGLGESHPEIMPLLTQMLMFGVRSFKAGKELEAAFEVTMKKLQDKAEQASNAPPPPNPEMMKVQGQLQLDKEKSQGEAQHAQAKLGIEQSRANSEIAILKAKTEAELQLKAAEIHAKYDLAYKSGELEKTIEFGKHKMQLESDQAIEGRKSAAADSEAQTANSAASSIQQSQKMIEQTAAMMAQLAQQLTSISQHLSTPKKVSVKRNENGELVGEIMNGNMP